MRGCPPVACLRCCRIGQVQGAPTIEGDPWIDQLYTGVLKEWLGWINADDCGLARHRSHRSDQRTCPAPPVEPTTTVGNGLAHGSLRWAEWHWR